MSLFSMELEKPAHREQPARLNSSTARGARPTTPSTQMIIESPVTTAAFLDSGTKISGKLYFEGSVHVDGNLDGEIDGKEITIGENAVVTAQIRADSIVVSGKVEGDITATHRIEIRATAKISGNITAPRLIIQEGAIFEGSCSTRDESNGHQKVPRLLLPAVVTEADWRELR